MLAKQHNQNPSNYTVQLTYELKCEPNTPIDQEGLDFLFILVIVHIMAGAWLMAWIHGEAVLKLSSTTKAAQLHQMADQRQLVVDSLWLW